MLYFKKPTKSKSAKYAFHKLYICKRGKRHSKNTFASVASLLFRLTSLQNYGCGAATAITDGGQSIDTPLLL